MTMRTEAYEKTARVEYSPIVSLTEEQAEQARTDRKSRTSNSAVRWIISKSLVSNDETTSFTGKISRRMFMDIFGFASRLGEENFHALGINEAWEWREGDYWFYMAKTKDAQYDRTRQGVFIQSGKIE